MHSHGQSSAVPHRRCASLPSSPVQRTVGQRVPPVNAWQRPALPPPLPSAQRGRHCQEHCGGTLLMQWSDNRGGSYLGTSFSLWGGGKRREERFRGVACDEVTIKAVPVGEPHRLSDLSGLMPPQSPILKMSLPAQRAS